MRHSTLYTCVLVCAGLLFASAIRADIAYETIWKSLYAEARSGKNSSDVACRVPSARMALLDSDLMDKEIPEVAGKSWQAKADWLLANGQAFISRDQSTETRWHEKVECDFDHTLEGIRPPDFGRAIVYPRLEVKGAGRNKNTVSDRNGVLSFRMALREFLFEKIESIYLTQLLPDLVHPVILTYGVADFGFHLRDGSVQLGNVSRQLSLRLQGEFNPQMMDHAIRLETALRVAGITSSLNSALDHISYHNIQMSTDGALVDNGTHQVFETKFPACQMGDFMVNKMSIPHLGAPFYLLGRDYERGGKPYLDRSVELVDRWATEFSAGSLSPNQLQGEVDKLLAGVRERAQQLPPLRNFTTLFLPASDGCGRRVVRYKQ